MTGRERLEAILEKMNHLARNGYDTEAAHSDADKLLVDVVLLVGAYTGFDDLIHRIIDSYENVSKWYA